MSIAVVFAAYLFLLMGIYVLFLRRIVVGLDYVEQVQNLLRQTADTAPSGEFPRVTVLVPVRNEEGTIGQVLREILDQEYPREKIEVIVLDDDSNDGTAEIAESIAARDPRARVLRVHKTSPGKKELLTAGVAAASGEIILTTDGDCAREPGWLRAMVATFGLGYVAVCGPVLYHRGASLFSRMQALEFMSLVGVGAGFVGIGTPRLANGANLGFRKSAFESVRGYEDDRH
ncbi:MAG: glycosyltransferase, partial [Chlorobi bacterium]|nr:glycosyltransferase [Chlorobiota bacterium]